jgi:hypothetical protein
MLAKCSVPRALALSPRKLTSRHNDPVYAILSFQTRPVQHLLSYADYFIRNDGTWTKLKRSVRFDSLA